MSRTLERILHGRLDGRTRKKVSAEPDVLAEAQEFQSRVQKLYDSVDLAIKLYDLKGTEMQFKKEIADRIGELKLDAEKLNAEVKLKITADSKDDLTDVDSTQAVATISVEPIQESDRSYRLR